MGRGQRWRPLVCGFSTLGMSYLQQTGTRFQVKNGGEPPASHEPRSEAQSLQPVQGVPVREVPGRDWPAGLGEGVRERTAGGTPAVVSLDSWGLKWEGQSRVGPSWCGALASNLCPRSPELGARLWGVTRDPQGILGNKRGRAGAGTISPPSSPGIPAKDTSGKPGGERDARQTRGSTASRRQLWGQHAGSARAGGTLALPQPHPHCGWSGGAQGPLRGCLGVSGCGGPGEETASPHSVILGKRRSTSTRLHPPRRERDTPAAVDRKAAGAASPVDYEMKGGLKPRKWRHFNARKRTAGTAPPPDGGPAGNVRSERPVPAQAVPGRWVPAPRAAHPLPASHSTAAAAPRPAVPSGGPAPAPGSQAGPSATPPRGISGSSPAPGREGLGPGLSLGGEAPGGRLCGHTTPSALAQSPAVGPGHPPSPVATRLTAGPRPPTRSCAAPR